MSKIPDFVLVYSKNIDENRKKILQTYISNIKASKLTTEEESGRILQDLNCVKVYAPDNILKKYSEDNSIDLSCDNPYYKPARLKRFKILQTILTSTNIGHDLYSRAPETIGGEKPKTFTQAERIFIVQKILSSVYYDVSPEDVGYSNMITKEVLIDAYPLHDSKYEWTNEGPLSDRQLLAKFWANLFYFYKEQPLNVIEKYYGPEVSFYFAWIGYYTRMLVPASILGFICFIIGFIIYAKERDIIIEEVCESDKIICPTCGTTKTCESVPLKNSCDLMKLAYILDNPATVIYSILMSFWGVVFIIMWNRKQAMLRYRWNINEIHSEYTVRKKFKETALVRVSSITGDSEYYLKGIHRIYKKLISYVVFILVFTIYFLGVVVVILIRLNITSYGRKSKNKKFRQNLSLFETILSAFLTFFIMQILDTIKNVVSTKLTEFENPRTQEEFCRDRSFKIIIFSCANTFIPMAYIAFMKGHFYTHPGENLKWTFLGIFKVDYCKISGCLLDLSFHLFAIFCFKNIVRLGHEMFWPFVNVFCRKSQVRSANFTATRWEEDFILETPKRGCLYTDYITVLLQYGFLTLFLVALPISPIIALINNVLEIRLDAIKYLKNHKRIIPTRVKGIEEWSSVMQIITFIGAISNPLLISFGSQLVPRTLYVIENTTSKGFINSTLSLFAISDFRAMEDACYYKGIRYPPYHQNKYQIRAEYWYQFSVKTIFFIVLENLCLLLCIFLWYVWPELPRKVQIKVEHEQRILRDAKKRKQDGAGSSR